MLVLIIYIYTCVCFIYIYMCSILVHAWDCVLALLDVSFLVLVDTIQCLPQPDEHRADVPRRVMLCMTLAVEWELDAYSYSYILLSFGVTRHLARIQLQGSCNKQDWFEGMPETGRQNACIASIKRHRTSTGSTKELTLASPAYHPLAIIAGFRRYPDIYPWSKFSNHRSGCFLAQP